jgi:hypothetical protein
MITVLSACGTPAPPPQSVNERAAEVIALMKQNNWEQVGSYVSGQKGIRLSPYGFVDVENDVFLNRTEMQQAWKENKMRTWGSYDGSGEPIKLRFREYVKKFIYDVDFANAETIRYNEVVGKGNSLHNLKEVYPAAKFIEYHFSGLDPKYEGMDWRSLRLVFEKDNGEWWLVAIIHDQWTI